LNYERDRKILADVDGVLLDWESAFDAWMSKEGYTVKVSNIYKQNERYDIGKWESDKLVKKFNECAWIGFLKPLRDSVDVLHKLASEHWHIECITSLSTDHWAGELRRMNLERFFGKGCVRRVRCIDTGADKDEILKEYEHSYWWIEDKPDNCEAGLRAGHKPILMDHPYNKDYQNPAVKRVQNWQDIYTLITESA
jgi:hypothetical protein